MVALKRNAQPVYYRTFAGKTDVRDTNGNRTGEKQITYNAVACIYGNVSASRGTAEIEQFGIDLAYSKTVVFGLPVTAIDESTTLWIGYGRVAEYGTGVSYSAGDVAIKDGAIQRYDGTAWHIEPHNYRVARVAHSLNHTTLAIREVNVE